MQSIDQYLLPDVSLSSKELAIVTQLNTLISDPSSRENGLSFILKRISQPMFREFLLRVHPQLYTHLLKSSNDDFGTLQVSLFIVHALSIYPHFINLLVKYDITVFEDLKSLLQSRDDPSITAHTLEIVLNASTSIEDKTLLQSLIDPLLSFFRGNVQHRNLAGKCLCILLTCSANQISFVKQEGIYAILNILYSHVYDEQLLASAMLLQLIKTPNKELAVKLRKIVILNNVLQLIKPLISTGGQLTIRAWQISALLTLATGYEKRFIQSGIFFDAVELIGDQNDKIKETLPCALTVILAVTIDSNLLDVCRGFSLADRLRNCVEHLNQYEPSLRLVILNIIRNLAVDEGLREELQTVKIANYLKTSLNDNNSLEKARIEILTLLKENIEPTSGINIGRDSVEVKRFADMNMKKTQAKQIVEEIVTTEQEYCEHLKCVVEEIKPNFQLVLSDKEIYDIFSNIEDVSNYQQKFLKVLQERWEQQKEREWVEISDLFENYFCEEMKNIYKEYMTRCNQANDYYQTLKKESKKVRKVALDLGIKRIYIPTFLIYPIQRLPRYLLLLETLSKNVPENYEEHNKLLSVKDRANKIVNWLNEEIRKYENEVSLKQWTNKLELSPVNNRIFIAEFHQVMVKASKMVNVCSIILFNDIVIFLKRKKNKDKILNQINLIDLKVFEVEDEKTTFMLVFPSPTNNNEDQRYMLYLSNDDEMKAIFSTLKKAVNLAKTQKKNMISRSVSLI
ncbi:RhoGEF domain containing protein [Entamoeba histolytica HM-1:IMSS-B]|uniref:DH domain-containing protein n=6 Tax=Entamoeba histolytica TaxID=5759 RepID=C4M2E2_ENTH1|nr:hypothetical protein EHI_158230 [Entamoeba histolytica HM-1:IMSS]EMD48567.1 rho/RAC guanine nucleotide exchange factor, putative [Entamoeba histolytica KU27]EMH72195.1 RhoGEF domain containing protein [Entamoeba histolytica HM-1:IMSS-B]EMS14628.1 Rho/RAC guanine nucleotide exchange factor, putative [Entamoeba histolytica HM-3:IMSS]ENY60944.1 Rho/RAC guanine nucleotide exchange factor, putative [Entamoeba histolytica HM-1:IMSS-A]GAT95444.1 hypothetical protein CL6EHI_158230 [Entamoeba histol|eukprot:XP_650820.2 hypothetical protein EHI_158230 [Entamoeba histolytica HM-1:IMSS]